MSRNLVVLLDGTSNEVKDDLTNILKLYRIVARSDEQRVFYHPGIGTVPLVSDWSPASRSAIATFGLATGWGLDANILAAYCYLVDTYRPGDRIFLFGFSRGAYTAWSALKYGFWSLKEDGHGETTQARRDCREASAG